MAVVPINYRVDALELWPTGIGHIPVRESSYLACRRVTIIIISGIKEQLECSLRTSVRVCSSGANEDGGDMGELVLIPLQSLSHTLAAFGLANCVWPGNVVVCYTL